MKKKTDLIILAVLLVIGIIVAIFLIHSNQQKADQYQQAVQMMDSGNPNKAYRLFRQLGNYRDSENQAARIVSSDPLLVYRIAKKDAKPHWGKDMQLQHLQRLGFIFGGQFLKKEHARIVDENVYGKVFSLTKSKQLLRRRFDS